MSNVASKAKYYIDSQSQGNKQLLKVKSGSFKDGRKTSTVNAVGIPNDEAAGTQRTPGGGEVSLEVYGETGREEADWYALLDSQETFTITRQIVGGRRTQARGCVVSDIDEKVDDSGAIMRTVNIVCLGFKQVSVVA